jgi:proline dehydrogenase
MINRIIAEVLPYMPKRLVRIVSGKYIAGETLEEAVKAIQSINSSGMKATLDILGESVEDRKVAKSYQQLYLGAIETAAALNLKTSFSLKPSMFGLLWDINFCHAQIREIIEKAKNHGFFVRVDMEDARCTQLEIELFERLYKEFKSQVGIVLQACLKRTLQDLIYLQGISEDNNPVNIRLCKGIYNEHPTIAYKSRNDIRKNFLRCLEYVVKHNLFPAIATHDRILIGDCITILNNHHFSFENFEFQMLYGVTPQLRSQLTEKGYSLRVYIPFGKQWLSYSSRRLKENPAMVWDIIKALFIKG